MPMSCRCGALLVEEVSEEGVTPLGGKPIRFRRGTDYIVCSSCHSVYRIADLQAGRPIEEALVGTQEEGESLVESLERLFETRPDEP